LAPGEGSPRVPPPSGEGFGIVLPSLLGEGCVPCEFPAVPHVRTSLLPSALAEGCVSRPRLLPSSPPPGSSPRPPHWSSPRPWPRAMLPPCGCFPRREPRAQLRTFPSPLAEGCG
jgi:hypothetical protein